jgi:hypothetical protein
MAAVSETHLISLIHNKQLYGWKKLPSIPRGTSSKVEFEKAIWNRSHFGCMHTFQAGRPELHGFRGGGGYF